MYIKSAILLLILFAYACDRGPLPQNTAQQLIEDTIDYAEFEQTCVFSMENFMLIYGKPEFITFHEEVICEPQVKIESIEYSSETEASVQYTVRYVPSRQIVNDILRAWEQLEDRYSEIKAERIPDHRYGFVYVYADPYDGEVFVQRPDDPAGLFETRQWELLTQIREDFELLADGEWQSEKFEIDLHKKNGIWEVVNSDSMIK